MLIQLLQKLFLVYFVSWIGYRLWHCSRQNYFDNIYIAVLLPALKILLSQDNTSADPTSDSWSKKSSVINNSVILQKQSSP